MFIQVKSKSASNKGSIIINLDSIEQIETIDDEHELIIFRRYGSTPMVVDMSRKELEDKISQSPNQLWIP